MSFNIPVYKPSLCGNEFKYVTDCLNSTRISSKGPYIDKFENDFSDFLKIKYSTTVSNGTVALHLALLCLGVKEGDEVIVPTLTYIASVNAIKYVGAKPIFVDADLLTWNIDVVAIEAKISKKTKAIIIVHLYGACCDMDKIIDLCEKHDILLIEDVAEAFGSKFKDKFAGSFGDIATFSFFGNKTITTGEGGMVVTNNKVLYEKAKFLKSQAVSMEKEYWHDEIGYNYRMTNLTAAIGVAQLERANEIISKKRQILEIYKNELNGLPIKFQNEDNKSFNTYWMISIVVENENIRDQIREELRLNSVETRPFFPPANVMPVFYTNEIFPNALKLSKTGINLPSYPDLSKEEVEFICTVIKKIY
jgi:perosamine synthetase